MQENHWRQSSYPTARDTIGVLYSPSKQNKRVCNPLDFPDTNGSPKRQDLVLIYKKNRTYHLVDFPDTNGSLKRQDLVLNNQNRTGQIADFTHHREQMKEIKKLDQYLDLAKKQKKTEDMKVWIRN